MSDADLAVALMERFGIRAEPYWDGTRWSATACSGCNVYDQYRAIGDSPTGAVLALIRMALDRISEERDRVEREAWVQRIVDASD